MSDDRTVIDGTLRAVIAADRLALSETAEEKELLRGRLTVFYGYFAALFVIFWVLERLGPTEPTESLVMRYGGLVILVLLGGMFLLLKYRLREPRALRIADISATLVIAVACAVSIAATPRVLLTDMSAVALFILFFALRAALVPSKPWLTTLLAALGAVPFAIALGVMYRDAGPTLGLHPAAATFGGIVWFAAGVAGVYVVSRTIYGLRSVVERAVTLGQYIMHEKIGEGGMGAVYRASHAMLKRPTAIKLIAPERAGETATARFEREVMAASRLSHPNNVAIYDFGRTRGGVFFYAMELLDGEDLSKLVGREGAQSERRTVRIFLQIAAALGEAHAAGLVHRDIKPENVMLCTRGGLPDFVKVLDFGLVKDVAAIDDLKLTTDRAIAGTPHYMAPESIVTPESVGPATDIYALGCVAYFLATGRPPFTGTNLVEICAAHVHEAPESPSKYAPAALSPVLEEVILGCLAKTPEERPTAARIQEALSAG